MLLELDKTTLHSVISFLSYQVVAKLESVSIYFRVIVAEMNYWQKLCEHHAQYKTIASGTTPVSWNQFYRILVCPPHFVI